MISNQFSKLVILSICATIITNQELCSGQEAICLTQVNIQTLRWMKNSKIDPPIKVLDHLSAGSKSVLFGYPAKDFEIAIVNANGQWQWRGKNNITLLNAGKGTENDFRIIQLILNQTEGKVGDVVIDNEVIRRVIHYEQLSKSWINISHGPIQLPMNAFHNLSRLDENYKNNILGDHLIEKPGVRNNLLPRSILLKPNKEFRTSLETWELSQFRKMTDTTEIASDDALRGLDGLIAQDIRNTQPTLVSVIRKSEKNEGLYEIPVEPGVSVFIKAVAGLDRTEPAIANADCAKLMEWMKEKKLQLFLVQDEKTSRISIQQWERLITFALKTEE